MDDNGGEKRMAGPDRFPRKLPAARYRSFSGRGGSELVLRMDRPAPNLTPRPLPPRRGAVKIRIMNEVATWVASAVRDKICCLRRPEQVAPTHGQIAV
nr:hypothetical protein Itr_chr12CG28410 [Ipomoea trifida]